MMNLKDNFNGQYLSNKNEFERILQLLNKNVEIFKYLLLKSNQLEHKLHSTDIKDTNRVSAFSKQENLEEWVSNQEIKPRKRKFSRSIVDIVEQWVENEVKRDIFKSLDAKYSHTLPHELSTKNVRDLGLRLISLADKLEGKG